MIKSRLEIKAQMKRLDDDFVDLYKKGAINWGALDNIKILKLTLNQKTLTKGEKLYKKFSKEVAESFKRGRDGK